MTSYHPGIPLSNGKYTTGSRGEYIYKARHEYICDECGERIPVGAYYVRVTPPYYMYGFPPKRYCMEHYV